MGARYSNRRIVLNDDDLYSKARAERKVRRMRQYVTAEMVYPTISQIQEMTRVKHIWTTGDRYYKLATQYYGRPDHWWIIAFYNQRPTEADVKLGDIIYIPLPLEQILRALET
tara:strand:- start:449 stop:787 length:339 start_codon:yes stop_codon:yes gene_type:complete